MVAKAAVQGATLEEAPTIASSICFRLFVFVLAARFVCLERFVLLHVLIVGAIVFEQVFVA